MFTYIRRPPFRGTTRLRRGCLHLPVPSLSNHVDLKLPIEFPFIPLRSSSLRFAVCQFAFCVQLFAFRCFGLILSTLGTQETFSKSLHFQPVSRTLKIRESPPRVAIRHENVSQIPSPGPEITKQTGKVRSLKTHDLYCGCGIPISGSQKP
jgi:hypothetical protein